MDVNERSYYYHGPVVIFGKCVDDRWSGYTRAISEKKAKSNLKYQYKLEHGLIAKSKIELPGILTYQE